MHEPERVLLIDDSSDDRYVACRRMRKRWPGTEVFEALDGVAAIELLETMEVLPDLILLDINMPRMDGHEFLEEWYVRRGMRIPVVIMLTSSDQARDVERAQAHDCVKLYLVKPMAVEDLDSIEGLDGPAGTA